MSTARTGLVLAEHDSRTAAAFCARQWNERRAQQWDTGPDERDADLALCDRGRLAGAAQRSAGSEGLRVDGALQAGVLEHSQYTDGGVSGLRLSLHETPTRFSHTPENELGAVAHWTQTLGAGLVVVAGADTHDVRVWDREQTYGATAALTNLHDHQRDSAGYAETMWVRGGWTATASGRLDWFQNYDGQQVQLNGASWTACCLATATELDQRVFDPRMGLSRKFAEHWAASASGFRAFRAPSPNELYRSTQWERR
jgi:outer membrane receptor protein involved in Fe transport